MIRDWTPGQEPDAGAWRGVPFGEYRKWPGLSKSLLAKARGGYPADWLLPVVPTAAMDKGSAVDCLIYDGPVAFEDRFPAIPEARKKDGTLYSDYLGSVPGKAWAAEQVAAGRTILSAADRDAVIHTASAIIAHPLAHLLLMAGAPQVSMLWDVRGRLRKGRADTIITADSPDWADVAEVFELSDECPGVIVDLKTTGTSKSGRAKTPREWAYHSHAFGYHLQGGWYAQGAHRTIAPGPWHVVLIQATIAAPWPVEVHEMHSELTDRGLLEMDELEELYCQCEDGDTWPTTLSATTPHMMRVERWMNREEGF